MIDAAEAAALPPYFNDFLLLSDLRSDAIVFYGGRTVPFKVNDAAKQVGASKRTFLRWVERCNVPGRRVGKVVSWPVERLYLLELRLEVVDSL